MCKKFVANAAGADSLMLPEVIAVQNSALQTLEGGASTPAVAERVRLWAQTTAIGAWVVIALATAQIASRYRQCGESAQRHEKSPAWH